MSKLVVVGRLVATTKSGEPIVAKLAQKPHPDTCWCRPADVALAALQGKEESRGPSDARR